MVKRPILTRRGELFEAILHRTYGRVIDEWRVGRAPDLAVISALRESA